MAFHSRLATVLAIEVHKKRHILPRKESISQQEIIFRSPADNLDDYFKSRIDAIISERKSQNMQQPDIYKSSLLHDVLDTFWFDTREEVDLLEWTIKRYPEAILHPKSDDFDGQLPLHIAICRGNTFLVDSLMKPLPDEERMKCLHTKATGKVFEPTAMGAELPLSVAALTGNTDMVDNLLKYGARPTEKNSKGDNVLHSIISYAKMYPEKADLMLKTMTYLMNEDLDMDMVNQSNLDEHFRWCMFLTKNNHGKNPLQLALQLGQLHIFKYILQKAYVYNDCDGLFDVDHCDLTDVDKSLTLVSESSSEEKEPHPLDNLFFLDPKTSIAFINYRPLYRLFRKRWIGYSNLFYITFFIHFVIMIMLTVAAVLRAERKPVGGVNTDVDGVNSTTDVMPAYIFCSPAKSVSDQFLITAGFISLVLAILYMLQEIWRLRKGRLQLQIKYILHPFSNNIFRLLIFIFALSLVADFIASWFSVYDEDFALLFAIIIGWFLLLFFLRATKQFCQFTSIVQMAMFDIIRFSVIILIELVAFTTVLYALIRGSKLEANEEGKEFQETWIKALFLVSQQIFGIGDLPLSNIRNRLIVNIVYIFFMVMTTVLMLNALIAIMSNTCTELFNSNDRPAHLRFHQYSIIRFFESILPDCYVQRKARQTMVEKEIYRYDPERKKSVQQTRFVFPMLSVGTIQKDSGVYEISSIGSILPMPSVRKFRKDTGVYVKISSSSSNISINSNSDDVIETQV